jgi:chromate transporter
LGLTSFGGLVAWLAFTMPSALILFAFAMGASALAGPVAEGFLHGLPAPACCRV